MVSLVDVFAARSKAHGLPDSDTVDCLIRPFKFASERASMFQLNRKAMLKAVDIDKVVDNNESFVRGFVYIMNNS